MFSEHKRLVELFLGFLTNTIRGLTVNELELPNELCYVAFCDANDREWNSGEEVQICERTYYYEKLQKTNWGIGNPVIVIKSDFEAG